MDTSDLTELLQQHEEGDAQALETVFARVYEELQQLARRQRQRWRGNETVNTTALVHEAYLKLVGHAELGLNGRAHFFALASRAMRQILCNYGREQRAQKRGDGQAKLELDENRLAVDMATLGRLAELDDALKSLEGKSPRACRVVECRFFGGMTVTETAAALDSSERTVKRDWEFAQAWLRRAMEADA